MEFINPDGLRSVPPVAPPPGSKTLLLKKGFLLITVSALFVFLILK
jgi:hypothetical protein